MFTTAALLLALQPQPEPSTSFAIGDEYTQADGQRVRWASVVYALPTGEDAEIFIAVDEDEHGEVWLMVSGESVAHATYNDDDGGGVSTWFALDADADVSAVLSGLTPMVADELFVALGPQEFKCSDFGKGVLKAARYLWTGMVAASGAACCGATGGPGCPACVGVAAIVNEVGKDALNNYCD